MTTYTPRHEDKTGANLTGTDGTVNRTITLTNSNSILAQMQLVIENTILQSVIDFTFSGGVITFLNKVWDSQNISLDYLTQDSVTVTESNYATTLQIVRFSGVGIEIQMEHLGTGDGSAVSYDMKKGNVVSDSYTLYYGADGSNDLNQLTETTHYSINKDAGTILLTSAGAIVLDTNELYESYTHSPKQSDTVLATYLAPAAREVEKLTRNYWGTVKTSTEYFDGYDSGYAHTDRPYGADISTQPEFELKVTGGVTAIVSVSFLDNTGTPSTVVTPSTSIRFSSEGRVILTTATVPNGKRNVEVVYLNGYTSVPELIQELTALIGGMMALVNISGGSYKDVSTYTIGRKTFSIGQVYVNIESSIRQMKARIDSITEDMGFRFAIA